MIKENWYKYYRLQRIANREAKKAYYDMILFGTGFFKMNDSNEPEHVPLEDMLASELN